MKCSARFRVHCCLPQFRIQGCSARPCFAQPCPVMLSMLLLLLLLLLLFVMFQQRSGARAGALYQASC